jgi:hypothetical protein
MVIHDFYAVTSSQKTRPAKTGTIGYAAALQGKEEGMKKSKFSEQEIATALRQVDAGAPIAEVTRALGQ